MSRQHRIPSDTQESRMSASDVKYNNNTILSSLRLTFEYRDIATILVPCFGMAILSIAAAYQQFSAPSS